MSTALLGVIANPVSARDIRRVVAHAGNLQITERVNILVRVLQAARAAGVDQALLMPDRGGIRALLERHLRRGDAAMPAIEFLEMEPTSTVDDTFAATRLLQRAGVAAIVVLGGDGTHRAVVRELVEAAADGTATLPIAGLSTGTNNAFPEMREPTITGLAAGLFAAARIAAAEATVPNKLVEVRIAAGRDPARHADRRDIAIVDAIKETAARGDVVIASHAAGIPLAGRPDLLRVLITASFESRAQRVAGATRRTKADVEKSLKESDAGRADYFRRFYRIERELPTHYDLVINTDSLMSDEAADIVIAAARRH